MNTDGNLAALKRHLAEREEHDTRVDLEELIEELVKERDAAVLWATEQHARADSYALRLAQERSNLEKSETKLAKAMEALRYYAVEAMPWDADDSLIARTTLAELEGK